MTHLDWLSELPDGWEAKPLRAVADYSVSNVDKIPAENESPVRLCNYSEVYNNEFIRLDLDFMQATATDEEISKFHLAVGDVIITKDSESWDDIGVPSLVEETADDLICGYHLAIIRPRPDQMTGRFLLRCFQAKPVRVQIELAASDGVTRFGVPKSEIAGAWLPAPPLPQQNFITAYLDHETARIDALIAAKKHSLDLLAEKRQAMITQAVTRGINPHHPVRNSGISWLGQIPAHWETSRVAWLFAERDQRCEPDLPLLEVSINAGVVLREFSDEKIESTAADFNTYKVARRGDVVFNKMRMWQGAVGVAPEDGLVSPDYVVASPTGVLLSEYAGLLFRTPSFSAECGSRSHGIVWDRLRLYWEEFRDISVPVPPPSEQKAIISQVAEQTQKIDALINANSRTIVLLKERRSALIAAAVTGELDIGGTA